jgi:hypothetical protein
MKKRCDLGDLSFTPEELEEISKAEQEERGGAGTTAPDAKIEPKMQQTLWRLFRRITAQ